MNSPWNPDVYGKAWDFASDYHRGQTYGGPKLGTKVSYLYHLGSVAMEVMWAISENTTNSSTTKWNANFAVQCALLHDVIEDTSCTYQDVVCHFGVEVADGVQALTKNSQLPKEQRMLDSIARIKQQPLEIWVVKMADRISNLQRPPVFWGVNEVLSYRDESQLIHHELKSGHHYQAIRLAEKIIAYQSFAVEDKQKALSG